MLDPVRNFAKVKVSTLYDADDITIELSSGYGALLPDPDVDGEFNLVWYNDTDYPDPSDDPNKEIVRCVGRTVDTLTIERAQESTTATVKNKHGKVYKMLLALTKKTMDDIDSRFIYGYKETPIGAIDGVNTDYTLTYIPLNYTGTLFLNDQPLTEGVDYIVTAPLKSITMSTAIDPTQYPTGFPFIFKYLTYDVVPDGMSFDSGFDDGFL